MNKYKHKKQQGNTLICESKKYLENLRGNVG